MLALHRVCRLSCPLSLFLAPNTESIPKNQEPGSDLQCCGLPQWKHTHVVSCYFSGTEAPWRKVPPDDFMASVKRYPICVFWGTTRSIRLYERR